jgi:hypothetical protein
MSQGIEYNGAVGGSPSWSSYLLQIDKSNANHYNKTSITYYTKCELCGR